MGDPPLIKIGRFDNKKREIKSMTMQHCRWVEWTLFRTNARYAGNTDAAPIRVPECHRRSKCLEGKAFCFRPEQSVETINTACVDPKEHPWRSYSDGWTVVRPPRRLHGNFFDFFAPDPAIAGIKHRLFENLEQIRIQFPRHLCHLLDRLAR